MDSMQNTHSVASTHIPVLVVQLLMRLASRNKHSDSDQGEVGIVPKETNHKSPKMCIRQINQQGDGYSIQDLLDMTGSNLLYIAFFDMCVCSTQGTKSPSAPHRPV
jgi:hypothetical protein